MTNSNKSLRLLSLSALVLLAAAIFPGHAMNAQNKAARKTVLYVAVGADITRYDVDLKTGVLTKQDTIHVPAYVHEAAISHSKKFLYVAWSDRDDTNLTIPYGQYGVSAYRIDPTSGALTLQAQPQKLPYTADYITTDMNDTHVLASYNDPSYLSVNPILADGSVGPEIKQPGKLDFGIYAHQVRVDPSNKAAFLLSRGIGPTATAAENPGALRVFNYKDGMLSLRQTIAPNGGYNFQVRHMDFHPSGKWVYAGLERQSQIQVYSRSADGTLSNAAIFIKSSLADPSQAGNGQTLSYVRMSPNGKFLYVGNRGNLTTDFQGQKVFASGQNNIAVFSINQQTGEPTLIQNADSHGYVPRTFAIDPTASLLIAGNMTEELVRNGSSVTTVPARAVVFQIQSDGKLEFVKQYDYKTSGGNHLFWTGIVSLP